MSKADGDEIVIIRGHRHVVCDCGTCGTVYTVNEVRYDYMRRAGGYAHCPNGHQWGWSEGTKQRDELRLERDRLRQEQARLIDERNEALRDASAAKSKLAKQAKRAQHGVCPCCNRTFAQLARHMKTKHPLYATQ